MPRVIQKIYSIELLLPLFIFFSRSFFSLFLVVFARFWEYEKQRTQFSNSNNRTQQKKNSYRCRLQTVDSGEALLTPHHCVSACTWMRWWRKSLTFNSLNISPFAFYFLFANKKIPFSQSSTSCRCWQLRLHYRIMSFTLGTAELIHVALNNEITMEDTFNNNNNENSVSSVKREHEQRYRSRNMFRASIEVYCGSEAALK